MSRLNVLIVGAGPAGLAAALRAQESGAQVTIIDDNVSAGGQIWRGMNESRFQILLGTQVIARGPDEKSLLVENCGKAFEIRFDKLILATGAREMFLPFPGWTLPGVFGAGGLQALAKSGLSVRDKQVVIGGSGPLLLAVAAYLRKAGAHVKLIAEQASASAIAAFGFEILRHPEKLMQAIRLGIGLAYRTGCWVEAAEGSSRLERVRFRQGGKSWVETCDYAGIAYGLTPNTELAALLGCRLEANAVSVNEWQQTSTDSISAAGECTGIGGVDLSQVEGEIAGYTACGEMEQAQRLFRKRERARRFAQTLHRAFELREELRALPRPATIVCRCEDVPYQKLQQATSFRGAKLHTRCGMGPCQGRICGPATEFLFGWKDDSVRPPVLAARAASFLIQREDSIAQ